MTTLASVPIDRAAILLYDLGNTHWTRAFLLGWLNEAQKEIALLKPEAAAYTTSVLLVTGTRQTIPADGIALLEVQMNMGTTGSVEGLRPNLIDLTYLSQAKPNWHLDTASAEVKHWMLDPRHRKNFWVYPKQPAASQGYVQILYGRLPAEISSEGSALSIGDEYLTPAINYMMSRAYQMGSKAEDAAAASGFYNQMLTNLGLQAQNNDKQDPRTQPIPRQAAINR